MSTGLTITTQTESGSKSLRKAPVRRDAEGFLALRRSEILRGVYKQPVKISLGEFGERYMEHAKANKRSWLRDEQMLNHLCRVFRQRKATGGSNFRANRELQNSAAGQNRRLYG